jgi:hypothetical protein
MSLGRVRREVDVEVIVGGCGGPAGATGGLPGSKLE